MKNFSLILLFLLSFPLIADDKKSDQEKNEQTNKKETKEKIEAELNPKRWSAFASYAIWDTWLPGKWGASAVYGDSSRTYELAYQKASYPFDLIIDDLGEISDTRIHLTTRSFTWDNSFNFQYGVYYQDLEVTLGNEYIRAVGADYELLRISTLGGAWGFGNRWTWNKHWNFGVDWFKVFWPFQTVRQDTPFIDETDDSGDKDDVEGLVNAFARVPTFSFLFVEFGYTF